MEQFSSKEIIKEAFDLGFQMYHTMKAAQAGDRNAQAFLWQAQKAAEEGGMMPPEAMADPNAGMDPNAMAPAPAPVPGPQIQCPSCGSQITPNPDGTCPACGFNLNTLASQAPTADAVAQTAGDIKMAAARDPRIMHELVQKYAHVIQR